jgi:hemerythrin-like domain-containing protein
MQRIISLLYQTHSETKEKVLIMNDFLLKYDRANFYEDTSDALSFLYKHIPLHFAYEEIVINTLLKKGTLAESEKSNLGKILDEHKALLGHFNKIQVITIERDKGGRDRREEYISEINETLALLMSHAEFEDEYLFPLAEKMIDDAEFGRIKEEISKIAL